MHVYSSVNPLSRCVKIWCWLRACCKAIFLNSSALALYGPLINLLFRRQTSIYSHYLPYSDIVTHNLNERNTYQSKYFSLWPDLNYPLFQVKGLDFRQ